MKNDINFRNNLIIKYLASLVKINNRDVFNVYYGQVQDYIKSIIENPTSIEQLETVRRIIDFKKNEKALEM